jgi:hypothetical protein
VTVSGVSHWVLHRAVAPGGPGGAAAPQTPRRAVAGGWGGCAAAGRMGGRAQPRGGVRVSPHVRLPARRAQLRDHRETPPDKERHSSPPGPLKVYRAGTVGRPGPPGSVVRGDKVTPPPPRARRAAELPFPRCSASRALASARVPLLTRWPAPPEPRRALPQRPRRRG